MESTFNIIAEPNRRAILSLLASSEQVGEIKRQLRMRQPSVSKHLRALRETGFVVANVDAQRRRFDSRFGLRSLSVSDIAVFFVDWLCGNPGWLDNKSESCDERLV